jgi:hypothetical protein
LQIFCINCFSAIIHTICGKQQVSVIFTSYMSKTSLKDKRIADLVDQNYVHAYVLFYLGIRFYEHSEYTLEQVCQERGLKVEQVVKELE